MPANPLDPVLIDLGPVADGGEGDPLRTGGAKINTTKLDYGAAINALADSVGIDIGDVNLGAGPPAVQNQTVKAALIALAGAATGQIELRPFPLPDETVAQTEPVLADLTVTGVRLYMAGSAPTSAGDVELEVEGSNGNLLSAASINLKALAADTLHTLALTSSSSARQLDAGDVVTASIKSDNLDAVFGSVQVYLITEPR